MTDQHVANIRRAIETLVAARRTEVTQVANNASNAAAREKLVSIQTTIEVLEHALEHEERCELVERSRPSDIE